MIPFAFQFSLDAFSDQEKLWIIVVLFVTIFILFLSALGQFRGVPLFDLIFPNMKVPEEAKTRITPWIKRRLLLAVVVIGIALAFGLYQIYQNHLLTGSL